MDAITMDRLILGSVFDIPQILELEISQEINEHGRLVLCGSLKDDEKLAETIQAEGTRLKLGYREADGTPHDLPLFDGLIERVHIFREGGLSRVILSAVSGSWLLDKEERSHSFQNVGMDYAGVVDQVVAGVGGTAICSEGEGVSIGKPLIQYRETDWSFLRRLASHFNSYLVPDITSAKPCLWFGMRQGNGEAEFLEPKVDTGLDKRYYEVDGEGAGIPKAAFLYRMVEDAGDFKIGDLTPELGAGFRICGKKVQSKGGILLFTYRSGRPEGQSTQMEYNEQFTGLSLGGTVSGTDKETVRVSLDIDGVEGSYPYPWAPPTGNIMYCMPKPGTKASLYFRSHDEREGQATNSPRSNGGACSGMSNPSKRTLTTEHGKQLNLFADCMSMIGSGDGVNPLQLMMPDAGGMVLQSHSKFEMVSQGGIRLEAPQVAFHTPQEVNACRTSVHVPLKGAMIRPKGTGKNPPTGGGDSSFTMNYEFNALGAKGVLCGWEFTTYEPFQDAPEQVAVPEEKVTYASLWGNVLAGLILVTVAAVAVAYVASTVFTMGASATVAPLVIGGLVGAVGSAMVFASADQDVANNENSGPIAYMFNGLVGALTGAVLGTTIMLAPFAAETAVMMYAPYGMDIFGKSMTPQTLTKLGSIGCYLVTGANALFKTFESQEMISGENLLRDNMPEGVYNDLSDMSAAGTTAITLMGLMNPNYMSEPKGAAGDITKNANSIKGGRGTGNPYAHLEDPPNVGPGNDFTQSQKNQIIQENMKRNNGVVKSDMSGQELVKPQKSQKGVTPPQNEWQIDHITPKDKGGSNSFDNAQVLSREENRTKSNK